LPSWKGSVDWPGLSLLGANRMSFSALLAKGDLRMAKTTHRPWSAQEDIDLLTSIEKKLSIGEIAKHLDRTNAECRARLDEITRAADGVFPRDTAAS
jgi:hypothetical protein